MARMSRGTGSAGGQTKRTVDIYPRWMVDSRTDSVVGSWDSAYTDGYCARSGTLYSGLFPNGSNPPGGIGQYGGRVAAYIDSFGSTLKSFYSLMAPRVNVVR